MCNSLGNSGCDSADNTSDRPALGSTRLGEQLWLLWLDLKANFSWASDRADLGNDSFGTHRRDLLTMDPQSRHCGILYSKQLGSHCLSHDGHHHLPPPSDVRHCGSRPTLTHARNDTIPCPEPAIFDWMVTLSRTT